MAISKTGAAFKALTFDGESSRNYGVYITGEAVYNAPERAVEMVSIPGRNGAFPVDAGRFENIEVTYPAGIFADTEADFVQAMADFRNFLCSKIGYCRLEDEYNIGEYREAVYKSGLEVDPKLYRAGEFEIIFECKPQRFLASGESAITLTSGDTVTNPTHFPASPLLKVDGYGDITINGQRLTVNPAYLGDVTIEGAASWTDSGYADYPYLGALNTGDAFRINNLSLRVRYLDVSGFNVSASYIDAGSVTFDSAVLTPSDFVDIYQHTRARVLDIYLNTGAIEFEKGTSKSGTLAASVVLRDAQHGTTGTETLSLAYSYSGGLLNITTTLPSAALHWGIQQSETGFSSITGYSTITANAQAHIDLDIGEAWKDVNGEAVHLNDLVSLPAELPTLKTGANVITFANTITQLSITPRWWII